MSNVHSEEVEKFNALAASWWDPAGKFRALHDINPFRLEYIAERVEIEGSRCLDVGCGGGILSEALAHRGAEVTGIDLAEKPLAIARTHAESTGASVNYRLITAEDLLPDEAGRYDIVTCLELLEHVPNPGQLVKACADLAGPGGHLFFSTINRDPRAWLLAIVGAEYVLNILPRGTHDYSRLIKPSELAGFLRRASLQLEDLCGMRYNPFTHQAKASRDLSTNYIVHARKPLAGR